MHPQHVKRPFVAPTLHREASLASVTLWSSGGDAGVEEQEHEGYEGST
ncbi:MAG TPA: hypothetical protein VH116_06385 [Gemmatimonadales bacterium]|jgi:hypothetical protein|nr:hypothetical protein [Gemmatimonadales bacterium]